MSRFPLHPRTAATGLRLVAAIGALLACLAGAIPALAHAELDHAEPAAGSTVAQAPGQLQLFFTEDLDGSYSRVQVFNDRREQIDKGDSHVAPDNPRSLIVSLNGNLPDGVYTVSWRTLSAVDGHIVNGAYPLIFGTLPQGAAVPVAATSQAEFSVETAVGRWWFFLAASALFGGLLSWLLVFSPLLPSKRSPVTRALASTRLRHLALAAAVVLLLGTIYGAVAQAATVADAPIWGGLGSPLVDLLARGRFAAIWWARFALVLITLALIAWRGVEGWPGRVALLLAAGALLTSSLTSHAAALTSGPYDAVAMDWLHFMAVGAWVGGLLALAYVLPPAHAVTRQAGEAFLGRAIRRFSSLAMVATGVIIVTGTFAAWLEIGAWNGLWQTSYGQSVLVKIILMAAMLALGAYNLLVVGPRLAQSQASSGQPLSTQARRFAISSRVELGLAVAVFTAAAVLTGVTPGREQLAQQANNISSGPVDRSVSSGGVTARIQITPAAVGQDQFTVTLPGTDPSIVERVQLDLTYLDQELGTQTQLLDRSSTDPTTWQATSALLSQAGSWQAELFLRRTGQDDVRTAIRFGVTGPGGAAASTASAGASYPLLPTPMASLAYVLIAVGLGFAVWGALRGGKSARRVRAPLAAAGILVALCGGYVYAQEAQNGAPLDVTNVRNPVPPDDQALTAGKQVYEDNCAICHGETGRGDGPGGLRLNPRPADLRVHMAAGHTDGQLFYWITYGVAGTAMPAWGSQLSETQRWQVIDYIRTFADPTAH